MRRRAAALAGLLLAAGCLAGCAPAPDEVTVLGPWVGAEETAFRTVLDAAGVPYRYQGSRNAGEELQSAVQSGNPPDIAVLPTIGDLARPIADGTARPLEDLIAADRARYDPFWLPEPAQDGRPTGHVYSVPVKANLKSLVWYDPTGGPPPATWAEAMDPGRRWTWCMGLSSPPSSGWPASDWVEDLLLHQSGEATYAQWAQGDLDWTSGEIGKAWQAWAEIVQQRTPGGAAAALTTQFDDAGRGLLDGGPGSCRLDHQPSFIRAVYRGYDPDPGRFAAVPLPAGDGAHPRYEVSVDVAALLGRSAAAEQLIAFLASARAQRIWPALPDSGAFSVHQDVPADVHGNETDRTIARTLTGREERFCLDAADLMPAAVRDAFYRGLREYLGAPEQLSGILARLQKLAVASRSAVVIPACA